LNIRRIFDADKQNRGSKAHAMSCGLQILTWEIFIYTIIIASE